VTTQSSRSDHAVILLIENWRMAYSARKIGDCAIVEGDVEHQTVRIRVTWERGLHSSVHVYGRMLVVGEESATGFLTSLLTGLRSGMSQCLL
jgi:hypothetical protein